MNVMNAGLISYWKEINIALNAVKNCHGYGTKMAKISIIIPCYNQAEYLPTALDSVLNQTYDNYEIIAFNDCSLDNTSQILFDYQDKYFKDKIKIIETNERVGVYESYHMALKECSGEYVVWLMSDNALKENCLEVLSIELDNGYDIAYGKQEIWSEDFKEMIRVSEKTKVPFDFEESILGMKDDWKMIKFSTAFMYKKKVHDVVGDISFLLCDEATFIAECAINFFKIKGIDLTLTKYRQHKTRETDNHSKESWDKVMYTILLKQYYYRNWIMQKLGNIQIDFAFEGNHKIGQFTGNELKTIFPRLQNLKSADYWEEIFKVIFRTGNIEVAESIYNDAGLCLKTVNSEIEFNEIPLYYFWFKQNIKDEYEKRFYMAVCLFKYLKRFYPEKVSYILLIILDHLFFLYINKKFGLMIPIWIDYINETFFEGKLNFNHDYNKLLPYDQRTEILLVDLKNFMNKKIEKEAYEDEDDDYLDDIFED